MNERTNGWMNDYIQNGFMFNTFIKHAGSVHHLRQQQPQHQQHDHRQQY